MAKKTTEATDVEEPIDDGTPALSDLQALFALLMRSNDEQRARLLSAAAITFSVEDNVMAKLRRAR